jgi:hypothetical protein
MTIVSACAADARSNSMWRQVVAVRGDSLQLLELLTTFRRSKPDSNTLILQGDGVWFPEMHGLSWAAACRPRRPDDVPVGDIRPLLQMLLDATVMPMSDAPRADVAAWLRGESR